MWRPFQQKLLEEMRGDKIANDTWGQLNGVFYSAHAGCLKVTLDSQRRAVSEALSGGR